MLKPFIIHIIFFILLPKVLTFFLHRKLSNLNYKSEIFLRVKADFEIKMLENNFKEIPIQILLNDVPIDNDSLQSNRETSDLSDIYKIRDSNKNHFEGTDIYPNSDKIEDFINFSEKEGHSEINHLSDIEDLSQSIFIRHLSDTDKISDINPSLDTDKLLLDSNEITDSECPSDTFQSFGEDDQSDTNHPQKKDSLLIYINDKSDVHSTPEINSLFDEDSKTDDTSQLGEINSLSDVSNLPEINDNSEEINNNDKNNIINITLIWDTPLIDCSYLFYNLSSIIFVDLSKFDFSQVNNTQMMFGECLNIESIIFPPENINTPIQDMAYMFYNCKSLKELDLSKINISLVTNTESMFYGCKSLPYLNLENINTENVLNISKMFYGCESLRLLNISHFHTSEVIDLSYMFYNCKNLTELNLINYNITNVEKMEGLFEGCESIISLNIANFDFVKTNLSNDIFNSLINLKFLNFSNVHLYNNSEIANLFDNNKKLEYLDISNFNGENTIFNMENLFLNLNELIF